VHEDEPLVLMHSVLANTAITLWRRLARLGGFIGRGAERAAVQPHVERLRVKTPSLAQPVATLSGGNQQKVSLAKWLAAGVEVLIVDEPTVGIDVATKAHLHEALWELARGGLPILLISSDMPEMIHLADRIVVMDRFALAGEVRNTRRYDEVSQRIMALIHSHQVRGAEAS
jgi:ribose transport system ATP-binding protein